MDDLTAPAEPQQDELWLISYADLLTLLVGFFVLIIASVPMRQARFERIAASLSGTRQAPLQSLQEKIESLVARSPELKNRVVARDEGGSLGIEFKDALLFDSGSALVRSEARPAIAEIARLLRELPARPVTIEGHTDEVPIHTTPFHSNWELSSQRAINVLAALEAAGVERARMSSRAFADTRPILSSEGEIQRTASRRVVIRVE